MPPPAARRARRAPALLLGIFLLLAASLGPPASADPGLDPLASEAMVYYSEGPNLVLSTKAWTLIAPLTEKLASGARRAHETPASFDQAPIGAPAARLSGRAAAVQTAQAARETRRAPAVPARGDACRARRPPPPTEHSTCPASASPLLLRLPGKVGLFILGKQLYVFRTPGLLWVGAITLWERPPNRKGRAPFPS
jgi:hypothetical protein